MSQRTTKSNRRRPQNTGPKSLVGQKRQKLYSKTLKRVGEAIEAGFVLEAVALLESVISDRLEARMQNLGLECEGAGKFWPLTTMAETLAKRSQDPEEVKKVYREVPAWATSRNKVLHGLGKLAMEEEEDWGEKYAKAREAADVGLKLFRDLDKEVGKLNREKARK